MPTTRPPCRTGSGRHFYSCNLANTCSSMSCESARAKSVRMTFPPCPLLLRSARTRRRSSRLRTPNQQSPPQRGNPVANRPEYGSPHSKEYHLAQGLAIRYHHALNAHLRPLAPTWPSTPENSLTEKAKSGRNSTLQLPIQRGRRKAKVALESSTSFFT